MKKDSEQLEIPATGIAGLKKYWKEDALAGFMVFLLALPLSLAVAKASGFPAAMGVLSAIIGGLISIFFRVSELAIKGPGAGPITVCAAAVAEFGGGETGWQIASAALLLVALLQMLFGSFKLASLSDFFPRSAVRGMLAAIGLIIIFKHIPILLGNSPELYKGKSVLQLIADIPLFVPTLYWPLALLGLLGLGILFLLPLAKSPLLKKLPAPMLVLVFAVPLSAYLDFRETAGDFALVTIGDFWGDFGLHIDFSLSTSFVFWKYVFLFFFVVSLESLLTVKAVDTLDTSARTADPNADLLAVGAGNFLTALFGGSPLTSGVLRSSANIQFGAKTKWANIFHGFFLLLAMLLLIPLIELIPNAALAAMLIHAGYKLASPTEFLSIYRIGKEQFAVFCFTIIVTLLQDLLIGIAAGIALEFIFYLFMGTKLTNAFRADYQKTKLESRLIFEVIGAAQFSNIIGFKQALEQIETEKHIVLSFDSAELVDHSALAYFKYFQSNYELQGGKVDFRGFELLQGFSEHALATRVRK